jgi:hypothetical protein
VTGEALLTVLLELERHVAGAGWDRPPRLFALVATDRLLAEQPQLADRLGLRGSAAGGPLDALTGVEQEHFAAGANLVEDLALLSWPAAVHGCAVAVERTFLAAGLEREVPADPIAAAAYVAAHPQRQEIRVVVGVDRAGHRHGLARVRSRSDELLTGDDLVPDLAAALAHTLLEEA